MRSQRITKINRIHPLGSIQVCNKKFKAIHIIVISVCTEAVDRAPNGHTDIAIYRKNKAPWVVACLSQYHHIDKPFHTRNLQAFQRFHLIGPACLQTVGGNLSINPAWGKKAKHKNGTPEQKYYNRVKCFELSLQGALCCSVGCLSPTTFPLLI